MSDRRWHIEQWLRRILGVASLELTPASNDASFRRYWRVAYQGITRIVMDAPPDKEDCRPFIDVSKRLLEAGLNVPEVLAQDLERGFLLLTDLGCDLYLTLLSAETVERLYADAIKRLVTMQKQARIAHLPPYDRRLLREEMELFRVWLVGQELGIALNPQQHKLLDRAFDLLADSALAQPQVFVHRDYHSRNLLYTTQNNPGILDFQDAVLGPVSYDPVSLLRDCYIHWPIEQVEAWAFGYYEQARQASLIPHISADVFLRWFDLMGVQRHLKASGIFARLWHRDGKPGYLPDVPRTLSYIVEVGPKYPQLKELHQFLVERILPALAQRSSL